MQNPVESVIKVKQDDICLAFMIQVKSQLQVIFSLQELYSCRAALLETKLHVCKHIVDF